VINEDGMAIGRRNFLCANDDEAVVWAKQMESENPTEVWSGARFIARIEPEALTKT
jgi:photosystem II stability/assembly factor-like uncharacterized protein